MPSDNPRPTRTDMIREQPWILIVVGGLLVAGGQNADDYGVLVGMAGVLLAVAGVALWVVKVARRD